ncbi:bifunctional hydroxyacyl-CoA dehydrogenase/enoyl-CoA hydratase fox2 [Sporothrix bragantina]|uniref:Bifunctional hydroxyacyl-CoA dehydrogenase/enoyl-CoA hydratase fox2 n=1 Tax=Sporothrix bragantina TaxID=671064 RepID=A0ABP0AQ52_9PEZI
MTELRFDGQVAIVTGAANGLGKAYAFFLASRGASVVVNDLGGSLTGSGGSAAADSVVEKIVASGGKAVANYSSVENGSDIVQTAIDTFGRVDIVINNAGILRDVSFKNMTDKDWDDIHAVHLRGAYKTTQAAWPHFRKQKYGRVIVTSSAAGLYGNFGQCNYSSAKAGMIGFGETLAKEGAKYNIVTNIIAPVAASRMTATVLPPGILQYLAPEWVVPVVAVLVHPSNTTENGSIFEMGAGYAAKLRWERARGGLVRCDETMTPGAILAKWADVNDFTNAAHPTTTADMVSYLRQSNALPPNAPGKPVRFDGRVAVVTGAGAGLGRCYALLFAKLGAKVVVNDFVDPFTVVNEIKENGGTAVPNKVSVEDGDAVIKAAIDAFGRVDVLVNNAGILRDKSFQNMTDKMWDEIMNVHLRGTYKCARAAYPYMVKQKYGRIVNTTSTSGIYGNYGQANYAAAKTAVIGFSRALAVEGRRNNIFVNVISPSAGTQLTANVLPDEVVKTRKPDYVAPIVVLLCSDKCPSTATGQLFESGCGWQGRIRWQRTGGYNFPLDTPLTPEEVIKHWADIVNFDNGRADHPEAAADSRARIMANIDRYAKRAKSDSPVSVNYVAAIEQAKSARSAGTILSFTDKDTILYNISLGATKNQLPLVFEQHPDFRVLPTFGVIPATTATRPFNLQDIVPNFSPNMLLHGEHYLEIRKYPIPTSGTLVSFVKLVEVVDKEKASIAVVGTTTKDAVTGDDIFYNEFSLFLRGAGGFGGPSSRPSNGRSTTAYIVPVRSPDAVTKETTKADQAMVYRLNGDRNPLHIDSTFSAKGGFKEPILHGLCSFGIAGKHIFEKFGEIKNIKARFVGIVTPGQTLVTEMWRDGLVVRFQTRVQETGKLCMAGGGAELLGTTKTHL